RRAARPRATAGINELAGAVRSPSRLIGGHLGAAIRHRVEAKASAGARGRPRALPRWGAAGRSRGGRRAGVSSSSGESRTRGNVEIVPDLDAASGPRHLASPDLYRIVLSTFACPLSLRHLSAWSSEKGTIVALPMDTAS